MWGGLQPADSLSNESSRLERRLPPRMAAPQPKLIFMARAWAIRPWTLLIVAVLLGAAHDDFCRFCAR
jgi:hypothetical protein